ncbi:hypothetical protein H0H87_003729 [Tephrocybe sp. NHM501043]
MLEARTILRIKRKPPSTQSLGLDVPELDICYPTPDLADPFAPLWVLRTRGSNANLKADALKATVLDEQPHSTPHKRPHSTPPSALSAATHDDTPDHALVVHPHLSHLLPSIS